MHMVGIYKITNPIGKSYIGLSKEIKVRWKSYKNMSFQTNNLLKKSLEEYKFENHIFEVLEEINISLLTENKSNSLLRRRERWWIKKLDTFKNGLNENGGGSGCDKHTAKSKAKIGAANKGKPKPKGFGENRKKWQHTEEYKEKMRNAVRKPIGMYDVKGEFIRTFGTQQKAADWLGVKKQMIWNVLNGFVNKKSGNIITQCRGYVFKYLDT